MSELGTEAENELLFTTANEFYYDTEVKMVYITLSLYISLSVYISSHIFAHVDNTGIGKRGH